MTLSPPTRNRRSAQAGGGHPARMTEAQFLAWCGEKTRAEWVNGQVILMAPVSFEHAGLNLWLASLMSAYVERRELGVVVGPEYAVRLSRPRQLRVPDVLFVSRARAQLIRKTHLEGAPDLAVEIVSPDSEARDWREKYLAYQAARVREYWVIDPSSKHVEAYALGANRKYQQIAEVEGKIVSRVVSGWYLKPAWLWKARRPQVLTVLGELGVR